MVAVVEQEIFHRFLTQLVLEDQVEEELEVKELMVPLELLTQEVAVVVLEDNQVQVIT